MGLSIKGYVLEPPRVGSANSPFTFTPNDLITSQVAFDLAYPSDESVSRTDYLVTVQTDGLLVNATFGFTKNEGTTSAVVRRFDYDSFSGHFKPLPGSSPEDAGTLSPAANTTRLKVQAPIAALPTAPFRVSVGTGSGTTFGVTLVATDGAFGSPVPGVVELSLATGNLNWNTGDLTTYDGQAVRWQRQSFFNYTASTGRLGLAGDPFLLLNPIPGPGQYPRIRLGFGFHLTPIEKASEGAFSPDPLAGTVEWAKTTGRIKLHSTDVTANRPVYYDGVLFSWKVPLTSQPGGTVNVPAVIPAPIPGGDVIFRLASGYQFPFIRRVTAFDAGVLGEVQIRTDGAVQFSTVDQTIHSGAAVTVYFGDLPIDTGRGIAMRFYRSPVNLDGADPTVKDVSAIYKTVGAVWSSPIIQVPFVLLPATPLEDPGYPIKVRVEQGTGSFTTDDLPNLGVPVPPVGLGYLIDYETRQLNYAQRTNNQMVTFAEAGGALQLPNIPVRPENLLLEIESAPGVGNFTPLVQGQTMLFDPGPGIVTLTNQTGKRLVQGLAASFTGTLLTDPTVNFLTSGVQAGNLLVVPLGPAAGVYTITARTATTLTTDLPAVAPDTNLTYEVRTTGEVIADRYFQELVPIDPNTRLERIRALGPIQNEVVIFTGGAPATFPSSLVIQDTTTDFIVDGVLAGDTVVLTSGPDTGSYRRVTLVEATKLTVDRAFTSFSAANYRIERRLHVLPTFIPRTRIRLGSTLFATLVLKPDNGSFTAPALLAAGTVEISQQTGDLNFSLADVTAGPVVFWGLTLRLQYDFRISKDLGFFELTERLLTRDELYATYRPVTSDGVQPSVTEHVSFLIRKELTQPWPRPTTTNQVVFNPAGRTISLDIPPAVYRGGRPQDDTQIQVSTSLPSSITFLPNDGFMTDALPSGSNLEPDERVYVDYYVYEAVGGERTFNVLQPPVYAAQVILHLGLDRFTLVGDQTPAFPAGYLLRVEQQQVYLIGSSTYDAGTDLTTVTLAYGATFQDDFTNPKLFLSSGPIPLSPVFPQPSYFQTEMATFGAIPRGMPTFGLPGDQTLSYPKGTVVLFTDSATYYDLYLVSGASFKDGATTITLQQNVRQQYTSGVSVLKRSIRPILEDGVTQANLRSVPILTQGVTLFRRVTGQPGVLQKTPGDYKLDESGSLQYTPPLQPNESINLLYTSYRVVSAGTRIRASYTSLVTPDESNGLLNQILQADYSIFQGDSFYYRVETLTNFSGEVLQALEASAKSSSPSGGPTTSNSSSPTLSGQGNQSLWFTEGHTANVDYVSRRYLKFFNDNTNRLEDVLQDADGRIIGDTNGRFRFDGKIDNPARTTYAAVTNEIDDRFEISPFPISLTSIFPLVFTYIGTFVPLYQASQYSRLFPTQKPHLTALTTAGQDTSANTGDVIGDFGQKSMTTVPGVIYRRLPRARVMKPAAAGDTVLFVDHAHGDTAFNTPAFAAAMKVVITNRDGTILVSDATPLTVASIASGPERINVSALPTSIPVGATVFLCITGATPDTSYWKLYRQGFDVAVNADAGQLVFIKPFPPFDGSVPLVPPPLRVNPPNSGEFLEMDGTGFLQLSKTAFKFPALLGGVASDCGDQSIPILSPTTAQEITANPTESDGISAAIVEVVLPVTIPSVTLDGTGTLLTYANPFAAPLPQPYDLVEFTTGLNSGAGFRRVLTVGVNTLTVDSAFPFPGIGGDTIITATANVGPVSTCTIAGTTLTDAALSPLVHVGHTIVLTSGLNTGVRRQVVSILSATTLQLDFGVPSAALTTYRVSNHLRTYSRWSPVTGPANTQSAVLLTNDHNFTPTVVDSEVLAITRFFEGDVFSQTEGVLTDLLTPASNPGTVAGAVLTDAGQNFTAAGVTTASIIYVPSGANAGFYAIQSVDSATQVTATTPFPSPGAVNYRIIRPFGVGLLALQELFSVMSSAQAWATATATWVTLLLLTEPVTVPPGVVDPNIYANTLKTSDLTGRLAALAARLAVVTNPTSGTVPRVEAVVKTRDKLYDKRYAWIDARTNVESGSLYVIQRAVSDRIAASVKLYNDLLKMLSVETV